MFTACGRFIIPQAVDLVELIVIINKLVIVAYSWLFILLYL